MINVLNKISFWWNQSAKYYHRDLISGIKNLIRWFPTIWKDRDWDDHFIWELMMKKITFQSKYIATKDRYTRAKRDAEVMMTCVRLMGKVREEWYHVEYMDYHESTYDFVDCDMPGHKQLKITEISEKFDDYFKKYPKVYKKISTENPNESKSRIAFLISIENHKRAKRILFRLLENNIECWWD